MSTLFISAVSHEYFNTLNFMYKNESYRDLSILKRLLNSV